MQEIPYFIVDAFVNQKLYSGNPAAVCLLNKAIDQEKMQGIAKEFNFSETVFVNPKSSQPLELRFFKPSHEVKICGHATLGSAHILFEKYFPSENKLQFSTKFGMIHVSKEKEYLSIMLNSQELKKAKPPAELIDWLEFSKFECYEGIDRTIVCIDTVDKIKNFTFDRAKTKHLKKPIVIITAKTGSDSYCFRYFTPFEERIEDPATGTAQMFLAPFWSKRLSNKTLNSKQLSNRTGSFKTVVHDTKTGVQGQCRIFSNGVIH